MQLVWLLVLSLVVVMLGHHYGVLARRYRFDQTIVVATVAPTPAEAENYEEIEKMVVVDAQTGIEYNPYSKHHPGRHVCTAQKNVTVPVKTKQTFCRPVYKKYTERCLNNQLCTGVRLTYETAYRDVVMTKTTNRLMYFCCPGWIQIHNKSHGCNKPQCSVECKNGGSCVKPNFCICLKGFMGRFCEHDVDECKEQKPCDQICHNTPGSYRCECRENFLLQGDGQSCRKEGDDGTAFEVKDLEYDSLNRRLSKLETMLNANNQSSTNTILLNMSGSLGNITKEVSTLQDKLKEVERYESDVSLLRSKLSQLEEKTDRIDEIWRKYDKKRARYLAKYTAD